MRRLRIIGLLLTATGVVSLVVMVSSSLAAPPEIGRCVKVTPKTGHFTTNTCTKEAKPTKLGEYEWEAGVANEGKPGAKNHFTGLSGTATLETVNRLTVTCKHSVDGGEFTSPKTVGNVYVAFTECKEEGQGYRCSSPGANEEEIVANTLAGELVWEKFGAKPKKTAMRLFPQSSKVFVEFTCGPAPNSVRANASTGGILVSIPSGKMESKVEQKFIATKGKQKPDVYYTAKGEKLPCFLEAKLGGSVYQQAGQTETNVVTNEEALEVNYLV